MAPANVSADTRAMAFGTGRHLLPAGCNLTLRKSICRLHSRRSASGRLCDSSALPPAGEHPARRWAS